MYQVPVRLSSESGSDRRGLWSDGRFRKTESRVRPRGRRYLLYAGLVVGFCVLLAFAGCGSTEGNGTLIAAGGGVNFGAVTVGHISTATVSFKNTGTGAVAVSKVNVTGGPFAVAGSITFPLAIEAGATYTFQVQFSPSTAGQVTGAVTVMSNAATAPPTVSLTGLGVNASNASSAGILSGISCNNSSMVGSGTDNCFVALNGPAATGGVTVNLASSSTAVTVPATVTIPADTTGVGFSAKVAAVQSAQSAVLTATASGVSESFALQLNAARRILSASASRVSFGFVAINATATQTVVLTSSGTEAVTIESTALSGAGFSISGLTLPVALSPGQVIVLNLAFNPTGSGNVNGQLSIATNSTSGQSVTINLSGTGTGTAGGGSGGGGGGSGGGGGGSGTTPVPTTLTCSSATLTGSGTESCNVTLSAAAPTNGLVVTLASNNPAVSVPASVMIPNGANSGGFTAAAAAVTTAQVATLTATANGGTQSFAIQLNAAGALLTASQASVAFGNVLLNALGAQTLTLTSTGTMPVTISAAALTGSGFTMAGVSIPVTLNPGQSITLQLEFVPTIAGAATGQITVTSNATNGGTMAIPLSANGEVPYEVNLSWTAPASSADAVASYNVYRSVSGISSYQLVNSAVNPGTTFTDTTVENGQSYVYYVTSVDSAGVESSPSNAFDVAIP